MIKQNDKNTVTDPINLKAIEAAMNKLEDYIENIAKPVTSRDRGQEIQSQRRENQIFKTNTEEEAECVATFMKSLEQKELDT